MRLYSSDVHNVGARLLKLVRLDHAVSFNFLIYKTGDSRADPLAFRRSHIERLSR